MPALSPLIFSLPRFSYHLAKIGVQEKPRTTPSLKPIRLTNLLHFDASARICQFLLDGLSFFFGESFFDNLRCTIHQIFSFFQTQIRDFTNHFDNLNLISASASQMDSKLRLNRFSRCCRCLCSAPCSCCYSNWCSRDAPFPFQCLR